MKLLKNQSGFTLIELVLIIVVLGILAAVAMVQFGNIVGDAKNAALDGAVGPYSAQLALSVNTLRSLPTAGAASANPCGLGAGTSQTAVDCIYDLVAISGSGVLASAADVTGVSLSFALCTYTTCTCPAGDCGTALVPTAIVCGGATNRYVVVEYAAATGALTTSAKGNCA